MSLIFVGAQSINSRAILANEKMYMHDFFFVGGGGGHVPPQAPRSYAPAFNPRLSLLTEYKIV